MEKLSIIVVSVLFSSIIAMLGYFLKTAHKENKDMFKELAELKQLLIAIKIQVEKSIVTDIEEVKQNVRDLFDRTRHNESEISKLNEQVKNKVEK
ncbi:MAG: hypothetical protein H6586_06715 [Flavobacteriales bacterium]|nr:hypothetical protein [Flavobacteriales bacterium]